MSCNSFKNIAEPIILKFSNGNIIHWNDIIGKPTKFEPTEHNHIVNWDDIANKPTKFEPLEHTHTVNWDDIANKPTKFEPLEHTHTVNWDDIANKPEIDSWDKITLSAPINYELLLQNVIQQQPTFLFDIPLIGFTKFESVVTINFVYNSKNYQLPFYKESYSAKINNNVFSPSSTVYDKLTGNVYNEIQDMFSIIFLVTDKIKVYLNISGNSSDLNGYSNFSYFTKTNYKDLL